MDLRLVLLLSLTASAAARTLEALSDSAPAACELAPTLPGKQEVVINVSLDASRLLALCRGCGKSSFGRGLDFSDWYCEVEKTGDKATALCSASTLATKVPWFCAIDKRIAECCMAGVPCILCVAAAGLKVTGILALDADPCRGSYPVGPHLADACKGWHLPAPVLAHQDATTAAVLATKMAVCTPKAVPLSMVSYVLRDPTVQSCKELVAYIDLLCGVPCLCRTPLEFVTIIAGIKATDLLAIYNACGGLRLGGVNHRAAAAPSHWYGLPPSIPPKQHLYRSNGSFGSGLDFASSYSYCEVDETADRATALRRAASLATRFSWFCVVDKHTPECCMAVVPTVGPSGRPPFLCRVAAMPQLAGTGLNGTGILELYAGTCGGRCHLAGADECKDWHLAAPVQLTHQGATTSAVMVSPVAESASCTPRTLGFKATGLLGIYNASGGLPAVGADHKAAATSSEGTIMTTLKEPVKPSPLHDSWNLAEIFTTCVVLGAYFAIVTVIFFWAAYKEPTRFIMISGIIILGVLFWTMHTVQAAPPVQARLPVLQVELNFNDGYIRWSDDVHVVFTSLSKYEARRPGGTLKLLLNQAPKGFPPLAWLNVTVRDGPEWSKFTMRSDNGYISAYQNREATHSFTENVHLHPNSLDIGFAGSYAGLNGERKNLTAFNLNEKTAKEDLLILSRYRHGIDDPFRMKKALTTYIILLSEGQRFTEVDECIRNGWTTTCHLKRPEKLFVYWEVLSCGILEDWVPNLSHHNYDTDWVARRISTYYKARKDLNISRKNAPRLLRVLLLGKACELNAKRLTKL